MCHCSTEKKTGQPDAGTAWEKLGPGGGGATFIPTFSYHHSSEFMVRCDMTGSYLTTDSGNTYRQINFDNGASCYAYDPHDSSTIYVGSTTLNRSVDGGKTWTRLFPRAAEVTREYYQGDHAEYRITTSPASLYAEAEGHINTIRVDPLRPEALYFSMGNFFFYSFDRGQTWKREDLHHRVEYLYGNAASKKNELYIFTADALFTFNTADQSFVPHELPAAMSPAFSFAAGVRKNTGEVIMYALHHDVHQEISGEFGYSEIWRSEDNGATWAAISDSLITNRQGGIKPSFSMLVCPELDADQAYVVSNRYLEKKSGGSSSYWYGALKTADKGNSWAWVWKGGGGSGQYGVKDGSGPANLKDAWVEQAFGGEYIRLMDVGVFPSDGNIAIVTDWYRTMITHDGGKNWKEVYSVASGNGSFTSRGMDVTTAYGVHFDPFNKDHLAISYTDIGYHQSFDRGKTWSRSVNGVPTPWINTCYWVAFDPEVKDKVWSVWSGMHDFPRGKMTRDPKWKERRSASGGVCVSTDGGRSWTPTTAGMGDNSPATTIVIDPKSPAGNRTLYVTVHNKGVFKSTDDGKTWSLKNNGLDENTAAFDLRIGGNGNLWLTVTPVPVHRDGKKGTDYYPGAVYRSTDGAATWIKLHVADSLLFPNTIEVDPAKPDRVYLSCWSDITLSDLVGGDVTRTAGANPVLHTPGGIFMSEDGGNSWTSIFDPKQYVYGVSADSTHPGRLYCNTFNQAAYRSDDYGHTWKKIRGYDFHWGQRILADPNDSGQVFLTTYGSSIWHGKPLTE